MNEEYNITEKYTELLDNLITIIALSWIGTFLNLIFILFLR